MKKKRQRNGKSFLMRAKYIHRMARIRTKPIPLTILNQTRSEFFRSMNSRIYMLRSFIGQRRVKGELQTSRPLHLYILVEKKEEKKTPSLISYCENFVSYSHKSLTNFDEPLMLYTFTTGTLHLDQAHGVFTASPRPCFTSGDRYSGMSLWGIIQRKWHTSATLYRRF